MKYIFSLSFFLLFSLHLYAQNLSSTLGIEVEGRVSVELGRKGVAEKIFSSYAQNEELELLKYTFKTVSGEDREAYRLKFSDGRWFDVKEDRSINETVALTGYELVSDILYNENQLSDFIGFVEEVEALGGKADPYSAGLHINIGLDGAQREKVIRLLRLYALAEDALYSDLKVTNNRLRYCEKMSKDFRDFLKGPIGAEWTVQKIIDEFIPNKYFGINLQKLMAHGVVEFRSPNSTMKRSKILKISQFFLDLMAVAKDTSLALPDADTAPKTFYDWTSYFKNQLSGTCESALGA